MKGTENVKGLKEKARALEDSVFARENAKLLQQLRDWHGRQSRWIYCAIQAAAP